MKVVGEFCFEQLLGMEARTIVFLLSFSEDLMSVCPQSFFPQVINQPKMTLFLQLQLYL